jgi:hypothetical protein
VTVSNPTSVSPISVLVTKIYLEKFDDLVLVGNTEKFFSESGQHSHEDIHIPAQAASVTSTILFTPSEFLERLVALISAPKFLTTRYYGVLSSPSPHRRL